MMGRLVAFYISLACCMPVSPVMAEGRAADGKQHFEEQCVSCHTAEPADNGGNQGPSLAGIWSRPAGGDEEFEYTRELRESKLVWDAPTLDRFLAAPDQVVPGTAMVIAVLNQADRANLIAYFQSLANKSAAE
jgi:cytochrome c